MRTDELIRRVEYTKKKHENDRVFTGNTNIFAMCSDILPALQELKRYQDAEEATNNYLQSIDVSSENEMGVEVEIKTDTFIVIKKEDAMNYLSGTEQAYLARMLHTIAASRLDTGKRPVNSYYVCNVDEPYSVNVRNMILSGEAMKMKQKNNSEENK